MRHIILGAGAIGGTIGGLLFRHHHEVVLVARGAHREALRARGLTLHTPEGTLSLKVQVIGGPEEIELQPDDVLILATKTQDSLGILESWGARPVAGGGTAGEWLPLVCAQNGVENERLALRRFARVYGACLWLPALHVEPGVVAAYGAPFSGMIHLGRYPSGLDALGESLAARLNESRLVTHLVGDVMRWKWAKLLSNLNNAVQAIAAPGPEIAALCVRVEAEGAAVLAAAGIDFVSKEEEEQVRGDRVQHAPIQGVARGGGSTWQSLLRGRGTIESDYLNGEITLLGRQHGIPTPLNTGLQRLATQAARERWAPGQLPAAELEKRALG